jgi:hypothetical protein
MAFTKAQLEEVIKVLKQENKELKKEVKDLDNKQFENFTPNKLAISADKIDGKYYTILLEYDSVSGVGKIKEQLIIQPNEVHMLKAKTHEFLFEKIMKNNL